MFYKRSFLLCTLIEKTSFERENDYVDSKYSKELSNNFIDELILGKLNYVDESYKLLGPIDLVKCNIKIRKK